MEEETTQILLPRRLVTQRTLLFSFQCISYTPAFRSIPAHASATTVTYAVQNMWPHAVQLRSAESSEQTGHGRFGGCERALREAHEPDGWLFSVLRRAWGTYG